MQLLDLTLARVSAQYIDSIYHLTDAHFGQYIRISITLGVGSNGYLQRKITGSVPTTIHGTGTLPTFLMYPTLWPTGPYLGISIRDLVVNWARYSSTARGGGSAYALGWAIRGLDKLRRCKCKPQCQRFLDHFLVRKKKKKRTRNHPSKNASFRNCRVSG